MAKLANLVKMTTATTGTGTITLDSAVSGFLTFAQGGITDGQTVSYGIKDGVNSEVGRGVYTSAGTTLTRNVVHSTNANAAINLSGTAQVIISPIEDDFFRLNNTLGAFGVKLAAGTNVTANRTLTLTTGDADRTLDISGGSVTLPASVATVPFAGHDTAINLGLTASVAANALTIAVKTFAGTDPSASDPVYIPFRSPTAATGTPVWRTLSAASSIVVSSGSTLGTANATACRLWIVMFDDGGTLRLGVINCAVGGATITSIVPLIEEHPSSSTAEGGAGAADTAGIFYTGTAVTSKSFRILGYVDFNAGQATAGTWATSPSSLQLFGPAIKKPGDVVQTVAHYSSTGSTSTSTSLVDVTNGSVSITPTFAGNPVLIMASCAASVAAGGAGVNTEHIGALVADGTSIHVSDVGVVSGAGTNMSSRAHVAHTRLYSHNKDTSFAVKLQHRTTNAGGGATTGSIGITLQEICV